MENIKPLRNINDHSTINNRIEWVRVKLGYPINSFARKLGVTESSVINILGEKNSDPSYKMIQNIIRMFPVIDSVWFNNGIGEPLVEGVDIHKYQFSPEDGLTTLDTGIREKLNAKIKQIRVSLGMSQAVFADKIGVSRDIVSSIESNRQNIPIYVLEAIGINRVGKTPLNMNWFFYDIGNMWLREVTKEDKLEEVRRRQYAEE